MRNILRVLSLVIATGMAALLTFPTSMKAQQSIINPFPTPTAPPVTITAITETPKSNNVVFTDLGHGLILISICRDGGQPNSLVAMGFHNSGTTVATLNFLFSDGTNVTANGQALQAMFGEFQAIYNSKRIEGQFIFANPTGNTTVNLHAFDGGAFCEIRGTAVFAPNPPQPPLPLPAKQ